MRTLLLILVLGVPPLALQLASPVPRLDADAVEYYAHLRSLYFDGDVDFENEFAHFGILERYDKIRLVPFGEYIPLREVLPFLQVFAPLSREITPGQAEVIFSLR